VTSERKVGFLGKAQDHQLWELLVLLEASLQDGREDLSPCPIWKVDSSFAAFF